MTDSEVLTRAIECGIVDISTLEQDIAMKLKQKYLEQHKNKIWQGKNGLWYTTVPCSDKKDGRRLIKRKTREALEDAIVEHYENPNEDYSQTFQSVFQKWVDHKLEFEEICKGTYDRYIEDYNRFLKGTDFSKKRIKSITEDDIEDIIRQIIVEKQLKRKAYAGFRTIIMGTFKYAKRKKMTQISITIFFQELDLSNRMFRHEVRDDKKQVYTQNEVAILVKWLESHPNIINLGIAFDFYTGLRSGELCALKYSDLDGDELHIQRQQIRFRNEDGKYTYEIVDYTKTEEGDRYVYLPKKAVNIFRQMKLLNPFSEYVFMDQRKSQFNKYLRKACAECGLEFRSMHKIRKTYGTTLIDNGVEDSLIMSQMGHKDISTTRSYYYYSNKDNEYKRKQIENAVNF